MTKRQFGLPPQQFAEAFPFHLVIGANLEILQAGSAIFRILPNLTCGEPFQRHFRITRPVIPATFESLRSHPRTIFFLQALESPMQLKGQLLPHGEPDAVVFLGSPWLTDLDQIESLGLSLSDFAVHDSVADYLFLLQAQKTSLADSQRLAAILDKQQRALREINQNLTTQHAISRALSETPDPEEAARRILHILCRSFDWEVGAFWLLDDSRTRLRCREIIFPRDPEFDEIRRMNIKDAEASEDGLPRRVLAAQTPLWFPDLADDPSYPFAAILRAAALRDGFAFPVHSAGQILGVMAFAGRRIAKPGEVLLATVTEIGRKLGAFLERHWIAEALRASEGRFRALAAAASDVLITIDEKGVVRYANEAAQPVFGYSPDELIGQPLTILIPESLRRAHADGLERYVTTRIPRLSWKAIELPALRRDGSSIIVEVAFGEFVHEGHHYFCGILRDVSRRKRAESALRLNEARLSSIVETAVDGIIVADSKGTIETFNPAAERMFGWKAEDVLGKNVSMLMPSDIADRHDGYMARYVDGGEKRIIGIGREVTAIRKDGLTLPVELSLGETKVADQVKFTAILRDVTERKRVLAELERAKEDAEAADLAKSDFLANMSHEIRTPMNAVIGMTSLLMETDLTAQQADYAETIHSSGEALLAILNDILDFSKIESGKLELESHCFELRECVEQILDLFSAQAAEKQLELMCSFEDGTPRTVFGDSTRLRQVLVNLVSNALKFTEKGEVEVAVKGEPADEGACLLHFGVRDTGIGIPRERVDRLFKPFSQVEASTTRHFGGTGLGLAICRRLTELMGGTICVESTPGRGSTFHFSVRLGSGSDAALPEVPEGLRGKRLLVVDPNESLRRCLIREMKSWNLVCEAASGFDELRQRRLETAEFDAVIADASLLQEASGVFRRAGTDQPCRVVWLAHPGRESRVWAAAEGAADASFHVLSKPVKLEALKEALRRVLTLAGSQATAIEDSAVQLRDGRIGERMPLRILVVEDNPVNQKLARLLLERMGYEPQMASDGLSALEALRRRPTDVVLLDVQMPDMDGFEVTRRIHREWAASRRPYVIAMTAMAMSGDRDRCLSSGMDDYLSKPVRGGELQDALLRAHRGIADRKAVREPEMPPMVEEEGLLLELVDLFLQDTPLRLSALRRAVDDSDAGVVRREAHSLKGSALIFGARRFAAVAERIEMRGSEGALEGVPLLMEELEQEYCRLEAALRSTDARAPRPGED